MNRKLNLKYMPENAGYVFQVLADESFINKFTLVGGTALSIQINHRLSEDLDFLFDGEKLNIISIKRVISKLFDKYQIIKQDNDYQIDFIINEIKLTFFSSASVLIPFNVNNYSFHYRNINIALVEIIAALKLSAISQRNTIRDYYDLYYISKYILSLEKIINKTKELFPHLSPVTYTETLVYTKDIDENDLSQHLNPEINITKQGIADYFKAELKRII